MGYELECERKSYALVKELISEIGSTLEVRSGGDSMRPMIKKGDRLAIRPVQPGRVRIGDIVVFETGEELCAHRLIRKHYVNNRHIFITKSDKALEADPPFTHESLVGKISHIYSAKAALNLESAVWKAANLMLGLLHMFASSSVDTLRYCKRNLSKSLANV